MSPVWSHWGIMVGYHKPLNRCIKINVIVSLSQHITKASGTSGLMLSCLKNWMYHEYVSMIKSKLLDKKSFVMPLLFNVLLRYPWIQCSSIVWCMLTVIWRYLAKDLALLWKKVWYWSQIVWYESIVVVSCGLCPRLAWFTVWWIEGTACQLKVRVCLG